MEYIGTIFVAVICFVLGYVVGRIIKKDTLQDIINEAYKQGRLDGINETIMSYPMPEDTVLFNMGVEEGRRLEKEEQTRLPVHPDKWETPLG